MLHRWALYHRTRYETRETRDYRLQAIGGYQGGFM
jgi:hypothetical protein